MKLLFHPIVFQHETGRHPESRSRFGHFAHLQEETETPDGAAYIPLIHPESYIDKIRHFAHEALELDGDTKTSRHTYEAAAGAVGLAIKAMEQGDFALIRPPGHHAFREEAHGFCIFNNVAIAAQKAVNEGKKVLIIDIDGHMGDGTMDIFYNTDEVLFWSMHQYPAYPGNGAANEIGIGKGKGFTVNVPLPPGAGDDIFWHAVDYMMPIALQFNPDVVAISAGFDAHQFDPLLELRASTNFYYKFGQLMGKTFAGKLFAVLEGGYNAEELPHCVNNFVAGVNQQPMPYEEVGTTSGLRIWETYEMHLHTAAGMLHKFWKF